MTIYESHRRYMTRALELAARGQGHVEPNPMVGCVLVQAPEHGDPKIVGEGWHSRFGGPHAEIEAIDDAGPEAAGSTMYVTLEPCCHHGKTPPCTDSIVAAGIPRVVIAMEDPFVGVAGRGIEFLRQAGRDVVVGVMPNESARLNAPYLTRITKGRPWIVAKWAMTLDGKLATRTGHSQWISSEESRRIVHQLRGRVDAIMVGRDTARQDDPLLTARPPGPRVAKRIVLDSSATMPSESRLVQTAHQFPLRIVASESSPDSERQRLRAAGCEIFIASGETRSDKMRNLLKHLADEQMTNVLVEGGGELLGSLFDAGLIDEVHVFIAPKIVGGKDAVTPVAGVGLDEIPEGASLDGMTIQHLDQDVYISGRVKSDARMEFA